MPPLALVGNLSRDRVDDGAPRIGGAPYYGAFAFRTLGRQASLLAKCGESERRRFARALSGLGFAPTLLPSAETTSFSLRYENGERELEIGALADPWRPEEVAGLPRGGWVHVAPLARSDFPDETLEELARGRRLLLDVQGLLRPARTGRVILDGDFDRALLRHASVLKLSDEEARALGAVADLGVPEIVVTMGAQGSAVFTGGDLEAVPAREIRAPDPTGAGDAFAAAYMAARADGFRPTAAARRATAVVASILTARRRG